MPQPQSTAFFLLVMACFAGLCWWLVVARQLVFRVLAACLAFIPGVIFGVAAVNKYYDYYQSWSSAITDLTGQGKGLDLANIHGDSKAALDKLLGSTIYRTLAAEQGYTLRLSLTGKYSHLTRDIYIYLPPQYFQPAYRRYRFPVIELLHGFPGAPQDWITVLGVTTTFSDLIHQRKAEPAVLVMPDANGARGVSLQCLNQVNGPQDATYLARDVPSYISSVLRVWPPSRTWGIAGYSEGGFCAANLGLQYGTTFGFAGVLSGYFRPGPNQLDHPLRRVSPFDGSATLRKKNTPLDELTSLPAGTPVPRFWIGTGSQNASDVRNADIFRQLLVNRQPDVVLKIVPGGGHTAFTWRLLLTPMLRWMTPALANNVLLAEARARRLAHHLPAKHGGHRPGKKHPRSRHRPGTRHRRHQR